MYEDKVPSTSLGGCVDIPRRTLTERLKDERTQLATRLSELDAAIAALEAVPQIQSVLDLLQKVTRL